MYDPSGLYVDPILTAFSVGWKDQRLFGLDLFPQTPVNTKSGRYRVYDRSDWLIHRSRREPKTVANEVEGRKWSEDTFKTQEHSLQGGVSDEERQELHSQGGLANAVFGGDLQIDPEQDQLDYVIRSIRLEHELKVSTAIRDTGNYAAGNHTALTGTGTGTRWDNYALATPGDPNTAYSNPVANIKTAVQKIYMSTGRYPNVMIQPWDATGIIEEHPRVVDRHKNFSLTIDNWKVLIGIPEAEDFRIITVDSKYNQADNVDAAEDIVSFWGTDVALLLVDPTPGQKTMTFGKTFARSYPNGQMTPTERWREENRKTDVVRYNWTYDLKVVSSVAGYLIQTAVNAVT